MPSFLSVAIVLLLQPCMGVELVRRQAASVGSDAYLHLGSQTSKSDPTCSPHYIGTTNCVSGTLQINQADCERFYEEYNSEAFTCKWDGGQCVQGAKCTISAAALAKANSPAAAAPAAAAPAVRPFPASPDMSGSTAFSLCVTIKTSAADGTICAKAFSKWNEWKNGGSGQGKMLFVKGGQLSFDIGWVGVVRSNRRVHDGQEHRVCVQFKNSRYELVIDGVVDGTGLRAVPDPQDTVWTVGKGVGHRRGGTSLGNNGDMAPDFVGDIKEFEYKDAAGVVYKDA